MTDEFIETIPDNLDREAGAFYVKIFDEKGKEQSDVTELITSFEFDDDESKADKLTIEVNNYDLSLFDDPKWAKGNKIEAAWGYPGNMSPIRTCVIQKITGFGTLKVEALAKSILMHKETKARVFHEARRSEVVAKIALEHGYGPDQTDIEDTHAKIGTITQARMTDAQFLKHLAAREGFEFYVDHSGLHFHKRKLGTRPAREYVYFVDSRRGDVIDIDVDNDVTVKPAKVVAQGRDPLKKKDIKETGSNDTTKRDGLGEKIDIVDSKSGAKHTESKVTLLTNAPNATVAKREADGKFQKTQLAAVLLSTTVVGDPQISAKMVIQISNISKRLSGKYYIKNAKHKVVPGGGYVSIFKCRTDSGTAAATKATTNDKKAGDGKSLEPFDAVDEKTGVKTTSYRRSSGSK